MEFKILTNEKYSEILKIRQEYREEGIPAMLEESLEILLDELIKKQPKRILELGTATGCSGLLMLKTIESATLVTIEKFLERSNEADENFKKFNVRDRVTLIVGDSLEETIKLSGKFDFIFLDCNKSAYQRLYPYLKDLLSDNGVIVADNIYFKGLVKSTEPIKRKKRSIVYGLRRFNLMVENDEEVDSTFYDVGDGVVVIKKRG